MHHGQTNKAKSISERHFCVTVLNYLTDAPLAILGIHLHRITITRTYVELMPKI
jgi:hypothetical protein